MSSKVVYAALVCLFVASTSAAPAKSVGKEPIIECEKLVMPFCDPLFGCRMKSGGKCVFDASMPRAVINCTQALIDASAAVTDAQTSLTATFVAVRAVNWGVMQNTTAVMDVLKDASYKFDQAVKAYNATLIKYNAAMALLQQYTDALAAMEKSCSITVPPPPPTCPALILDLQTKVAKQNATAATVWIQVVMTKSMMDIASAPVDAAEAAIKTATTNAAQRYAEISKTITAATTAKDNAMTYWQQVVTACSAPPPAAKAEGDLFSDIHNLLFN